MVDKKDSRRDCNGLYKSRRNVLEEIGYGKERRGRVWDTEVQAVSGLLESRSLNKTPE